jgi:hypothetical protein
VALSAPIVVATGSSAMQDIAPQVRPLIGASDADYVES